MIFVFYFFVLLLIWQGTLSLIGGIRFARYVESELRRKANHFTPFASVIVPCRGIDDDLRDNLHSLWRQDYPRYELIFVFDSEADDAAGVIEELRHTGETAESAVARVRIVIAGRATDSGQKVHNLRAGVSEVNEGSEVFAFLDTDARPGEGWLRSLISPLADKNIGATTGYRWFVPERKGFAPLLRAVWNASITSTLGADGKRNFCWGGSTAIRRATFEALNVREQWRGTLSDDFTLTRTLHRAKLPIHFVPQCLVPSHEDCSFGELLEFTTRQIKITRVYAAPLWHIVLWSNLVFSSVFFGGIALAVYRIATGGNLLPLLLVACLYSLGIAKAAVRLRAVRRALAPRSAGGRLAACAQLFLFPLTSVLYAYNALAAARSRRITWRGIRYELKSADETAIIESANNTSPSTNAHEPEQGSRAPFAG